MRTFPIALSLVTLCAGHSAAQDFNLDFGPVGGTSGTPPSTFAAGGQAGHWTAVSAAAQSNLRDVNGNSTGASIAMSPGALFHECAVAGPGGDDGALLFDRVYYSWPADTKTITLQGLAPGPYRARAYGLNGCEAEWDFSIGFDHGPGPSTLCGAFTGAWGGALQEGAVFGTCEFTLAAGADLVLELCCPTLIEDSKLCALQLEQLDLWTDICLGDGGAGVCPCANQTAGAQGCANSSGNGARLVPSGSTSVAADDLRFTGFDLIPGRAALLFVGDQLAPSGVTLGDGLRCVGGAIQRLGVRAPQANGNANWSAGLQPVGGWQAGDRRGFQVWYRDTLGGPCGSGFNLSQAIDVTFVP